MQHLQDKTLSRRLKMFFFTRHLKCDKVSRSGRANNNTDEIVVALNAIHSRVPALQTVDAHAVVRQSEDKMVMVRRSRQS